MASTIAVAYLPLDDMDLSLFPCHHSEILQYEEPFPMKLYIYVYQQRRQQRYVDSFTC